MKHLLTFMIISAIVTVVYVSVDWDSIDLSLSSLSSESAGDESEQDSSFEKADYEEDDNFWIDTVMYAKGHAFGYRGDVTMWGGWYLDTVFVGDDNMLRYDSVGPSTLKLSLVTRDLIVDFGDKNVADKIRAFLSPISGFRRFQHNYEECLDSMTDEEYGTHRYIGELSFTVDYPDSGRENAAKINHFIGELTGISEIEKAKVPALSAFYAGYSQTKNYRPVYTGNVNDLKSLSDFLANRTFENWKRGGEYNFGSSGATLAIMPRVANERYVTFSVYEYDRVGTGHGMYTEKFHTFDLNSGKELTNKDIFKCQHLDKVKKRLFEVMANDSHYRAWHGDSITATDIQDRIEAWQSPVQIVEGGECEEPKRDVKFELPDGALTDLGVLFSFQPYEIDCWAAGAYHFIVPYDQLMPYMTPTAKRLTKSTK